VFGVGGRFARTHCGRVNGNAVFVFKMAKDQRFTDERSVAAGVCVSPFFARSGVQTGSAPNSQETRKVGVLCVPFVVVCCLLSDAADAAV